MCDNVLRVLLLLLVASSAIISNAVAFSDHLCGVMLFHTQTRSSQGRTHGLTSTMLEMSTASDMHPAVEGWPEKYAGTFVEGAEIGPRILHEEFTVTTGSDELIALLDVPNWPVWTTADKPKWDVGNQVVDKVMPYGELSYMISGKLEIIPASTGEPVIVKAGDFVTFPEKFKASWKVLEELTWHYYLY